MTNNSNTFCITKLKILILINSIYKYQHKFREHISILWLKTELLHLNECKKNTINFNLTKRTFSIKLKIFVKLGNNKFLFSKSYIQTNFR